jgi:hypothetical protein
MKKGDDVADDDDDPVRTSVSQDQVIATLCTEELFLRSRYTYTALSTYQTGKNLGRGRIWTVNMTHLVVPVGFHTSQLVFDAINRVFVKHWIHLLFFQDSPPLSTYLVCKSRQVPGK